MNDDEADIAEDEGKSVEQGAADDPVKSRLSSTDGGLIRRDTAFRRSHTLTMLMKRTEGERMSIKQSDTSNIPIVGPARSQKIFFMLKVNDAGNTPRARTSLLLELTSLCKAIVCKSNVVDRC